MELTERIRFRPEYVFCEVIPEFPAQTILQLTISFEFAKPV